MSDWLIDDSATYQSKEHESQEYGNSDSGDNAEEWNNVWRFGQISSLPAGLGSADSKFMSRQHYVRNTQTHFVIHQNFNYFGSLVDLL